MPAPGVVQVGTGRGKPPQAGHQRNVALLEDPARRTLPEDRVAARLPAPLDQAVQVGEVCIGNPGGTQGHGGPGSEGQGPGQCDGQQPLLVAKRRWLVVDVQLGDFETGIEAEEQRGQVGWPRLDQHLDIDVQLFARVDGDAAREMRDRRRGFVGNRLMSRQPGVAHMHPLDAAEQDNPDPCRSQRSRQDADEQSSAARDAIGALVQRRRPDHEGRREHQHGRTVQKRSEIGQPGRQVGSPVVVDVEERDDGQQVGWHEGESPHVYTEQGQRRTGDDHPIAHTGGEQQHERAPERQCRDGIHEEEDERRHRFDGVHPPPNRSTHRSDGLNQQQDPEQRQADGEHDRAEPTADERKVGEATRVHSLGHPFALVPLPEIEGE